MCRHIVSMLMISLYDVPNEYSCERCIVVCIVVRILREALVYKTMRVRVRRAHSRHIACKQNCFKADSFVHLLSHSLALAFTYTHVLINNNNKMKIRK